MIVKRKLYSVMDEEGNQGYYLYDEATGEERLFARGVGMSVQNATRMAQSKGLGAINKAAKNTHAMSVGWGGPRDLALSSGRRAIGRTDYKNVSQVHHNINMRGSLAKDGIYKNGFKVPQSYAEAAIGTSKKPLSMVRDATADFLRK